MSEAARGCFTHRGTLAPSNIKATRGVEQLRHLPLAVTANPCHSLVSAGEDILHAIDLMVLFLIVLLVDADRIDPCPSVILDAASDQGTVEVPSDWKRSALQQDLLGFYVGRTPAV